VLLGSFVGDLLGLEEVGDDDGVMVGDFVTGLSVGDLFEKSVGISMCSRETVAVVVVVSSLSTET